MSTASFLPLPLSGCSGDTEPSARTIAYLIDKVKEDRIPAVYYLELSSHRTAEIIQGGNRSNAPSSPFLPQRDQGSSSMRASPISSL